MACMTLELVNESSGNLLCTNISCGCTLGRSNTPAEAYTRAPKALDTLITGYGPTKRIVPGPRQSYLKHRFVDSRTPLLLL